MCNCNELEFKMKIKGNLTAQILISLVLATIVGSLMMYTGLSQNPMVKEYFIDGFLTIGGQGYMGLMKMMIIPLVGLGIFLSLAQNSDLAQTGRMGGKSVISYMLTTIIAITVGIALANLFGIGLGQEVAAGTFEPRPSPPISETFINMIPSNPIQAMVEGNMIALMVFAGFLAVGALKLIESSRISVVSAAEKANDIVLNVVGIVMDLAPYGLFMLMTKTISENGLESMEKLFGYFMVVILALAVQTFVVYPTYMAVFARINPINFFKKIGPVWVFGFSSASSAATMPVTMRVLEKGMGVSKKITSFNVPLGATLNMDGTSIMQGVATVFVANAYGIDLTIAAYAGIILTATLASMGTAAVRGAGSIMLAMVFQQAGLPVEGILMIMAVDSILDMIRTAVNLTGDSAVAMVVAKSEGELNMDIYNNPNAKGQPEIVDLPHSTDGEKAFPLKRQESA
jgi:Na+/H+-dicarboxylate symporter